MLSKNRAGKYFASMLIEIEQDVESKPVIDEEKIVAFDMSASNILITKEFRLTNPRSYRAEEKRLRRLHREASRKKKGSSNRDRARKKLAGVYEKINNQKKD